MTEQKDISARAVSLGRLLDRLKPGQYTIHLTWPHPRSGERPEAEVVLENLTPNRARAKTEVDNR